MESGEAKWGGGGIDSTGLQLEPALRFSPVNATEAVTTIESAERLRETGAARKAAAALPLLLLGACPAHAS